MAVNVDTIMYIIDHYIRSLPIKEPYRLLWIIPFVIIVWIIIQKPFIKFRQKDEKEHFKKATKGSRRLAMFTRTLMIILLVIAFASPYMHMQREIKGEPRLTILTDASNSFSLFDTSVAGQLKKSLEKQVPTKMIEIATEEYSAIADGILANMHGDDSLLVVSDGNNNKGRDLGDVLLFASQVNTTINALNMQPQKDDTAVRIEGPSTTIVGGDITFSVVTQQAGKKIPYHLVVDIDGNIILEKTQTGPQAFTFTKQLTEGFHKVNARVTSEVQDYFQQNNVFYKSINVVPKPKVLFVSSKTSPLEEKLKTLYEITSVGSVGGKNLKTFTAVFLNDIDANQLGKDDVDALTNYLIDGGGLFLMGGSSSFDVGDYKDSYLETILPVMSGEGEKEEDKQVNIVMVIDISGSTGATFGKKGEKKVDIEKALTAGIIKDLRDEDKIGVVAFNSQAYEISPMSPLSSKREEVVSLIAALKDGGGTDMETGIRMAEQMLVSQRGSRNIIIISDGVTVNDQGAIGRVQGARIGGIKTYTVGVGQKTDENLMKQIASVGNGIYFQPTESQHLKILFGDPEDDEKKGKSLVVIDSNHFITENLKLSGEVSGYNQVVPKSSANLLVTLANGAPMGVVWRFGLGKVGVIATDDGSKWGAGLLSLENSQLISRTLNWVIGDPTKTNNFGVFTKDTSLGEPVEVLVKSDKIPVSQLIEFNKIDESMYKGMFIPEKTGYVNVLDNLIAVNYNTEYMKVGLNPELESLVTITNGRMFKPNDQEGIIQHVRNHAVRTERQELSFKWPFVMAAILVFLFEIILRKVKENR